jgi:hypothetical protein
MRGTSMTTFAPETPEIQTHAGITGAVTPRSAVPVGAVVLPSLSGHRASWRFGRARRPRALVADAARGLDFVDDVLGVRRLIEGHFPPAREIRRHLRPEYDASAEARHPLLLEYASGLAEHGYTVLGVPDLRIDPKMDAFRRVNLDFGFCNILPGLRRRQASVYYFVSGVRALDADASHRIRLAGVEPVAVSTAEVASALMQLQGGLHCCCGSL